MLNKETALAFDNNVCDGFTQPTLAWSATTPDHVNGVGGSSMTSNFWVGSPEDVKAFAEKMAQFYQEFHNDSDNFDEELEDDESISVAYWENTDIAMCADLCTSDQIYNMLPIEFIEEAGKSLKHVLFNGNDNGPCSLLQNEESLLSVEELISLAPFMTYNGAVQVTEDDYRDDCLPDFSDDDIERLKATFQK